MQHAVISWGRNAFPVTGVAKEHASCKSFAFIYKQPYHRERERELDWGRSDSEASSDRYTTTRAPEGELPRPAAKNAQPQPAKTDLAGGAKTAYT